MKKTAIERVAGRRVWDSRGRPTVEAEIWLADGTSGRCIAPAGASRGSNEAVDLRDGGDACGGFGVDQAIANIAGPIAAALRGVDVADQETIDKILIELDGTPNKARLGGNATISVSMAALNTAAGAAGMPLWRHLAQGREVVLPLPEIQIFGGGAHAGRRIDIQDLLVMPVEASSFGEGLAMVADVYHAAGRIMSEAGKRAGVADEGGWWPAFGSNEEALDTLARSIDAAGYRNGEVVISLDIAASEFGRGGRYRLSLEDREYDTDGWIEVLLDWIRRYPIASIEDPVSEDDHDGMKRFTAAAGERLQIIGDDYLVTSAARVEASSRAGACNAVLLKPNQAGTITETRLAMEAAKRAGWGTIVSARSGETEDVTISHLAVGWNAGQLKVGSFARSERMAKWNEGLRIEEALGADARYAGGAVLRGGLSRP